MPTETHTALLADTLQVEIRFRRDAWTTEDLRVTRLVDILEGLEGLITYCVPRSQLFTEVPDHDGPFLVLERAKEDHTTVVYRLNYNSPLEIVLIISAAASVLTATATALIRVAKSLDEWRVKHAEVGLKIELLEFEKDLVIEARRAPITTSPEGNPRHEGVVKSRPTQVDQRVLDSLPLIESLLVIEPNAGPLQN